MGSHNLVLLYALVFFAFPTSRMIKELDFGLIGIIFTLVTHFFTLSSEIDLHPWHLKFPPNFVAYHLESIRP